MLVRVRRVTGFRPTASATPPSWAVDVRETWKPRLKGECERTCVLQHDVHRSLPAVVQLHAWVNLNVCPKQYVLAQALVLDTWKVPIAHG